MSLLAQMYEPERRSFIEKHNFYSQQCKTRLVAQFSDIDGEADQFFKEYAESLQPAFANNEDVDWGSFWDQVREEAFSHYSMLEDMKKITLLSVTAAIYHNWDKEFRGWLVKEMRFSFSEDSTEQIWKASITELCEFMASNGWDVGCSSSMKKIIVMQHLVNAYKHGSGRSFKKICDHHQEYLDEHVVEASLNGRRYKAKYDDIRVKEGQFDDFSDAITAFWQSVPATIVWQQENK